MLLNLSRVYSFVLVKSILFYEYTTISVSVPLLIKVRAISSFMLLLTKMLQTDLSKPFSFFFGSCLFIYLSILATPQGMKDLSSLTRDGISTWRLESPLGGLES